MSLTGLPAVRYVAGHLKLKWFLNRDAKLLLILIVKANFKPDGGGAVRRGWRVVKRPNYMTTAVGSMSGVPG